MDIGSLEWAVIDGKNLTKETDMIDLVGRLIKKHKSKKELNKFSNQELEEYLERYLNVLKELIRLCAEYGVQTSLYDIFAPLAVESEETDENLPIGEDFFHESCKEIIRVAESVDNADVIIFILKIMSDFSIFWKADIIGQILLQVVAKIPVDRADILLKRKNICSYSYFDSFLCRVLINHADKKIRDHSLRLLNQRINLDDDETKRIRDLENLCQHPSLNMLDQFLQHVNVEMGGLLTFSCFERMTESFGSGKTKDIVEKIIELKRQPIPTQFVNKFKEYTEINGPGILEIGELLIKGKYCEISDISCIDELIRNDESCQKTLNLISTAVNYANYIPNAICDEIKEKAITNVVADNLLKRCRQISGKEDAVDILANSRESKEGRRKKLEEILANTKRPTHRVVKVLVDLIQYEEDLRSECFQALIQVLPNDYLKQGFPLDLKTIISYISSTTEDLPSAISSLLRKDGTLDLSNTFVFCIQEEGTHFLKTALFLLTKLSKSSKGKQVIIDHLSDLLKKIRTIDSWENRDVECEKLMDIWNSESISEHSKPSLINIMNLYTTFLSINQSAKSINYDFLKRLKVSAQEGFPIPKNVVSFLIESLKNEKIRNFHFYIAKILVLINSVQNFGPEVRRQVFGAMMKNSQLFIMPGVINQLLNIMKEIILPDETRIQFADTFCENLDDLSMKHNLMEVASLIFKDFEMHSDGLEKVANILSEDADESNRIWAVRFLLRQITYTKRRMPHSVIEELETIVCNPVEDDSWELYDCAFQALEGNIGDDVKSTVFIQTYYTHLKSRLTQSNKPKCEDLNNPDHPFNKLIEAENVTNLKKIRLLKIVSYAISNQLNINIGTVFTRPQNEWLEMLLKSALIASILKCFIRTDENEFLVQRLWQNVNSVKKYLIELHLNDINDATEKFEAILQEIIYKKNIHSFELNAINVVLTTLGFSERASRSIFSPSDHLLTDLRQMWMENKLVLHGIKCNHEKTVEQKVDQIMKMCSYFKYGIMTLDMIFNKLKRNGEMCELLHFFELMDHYLPTEEEKKHFLANDILRNASISDWILQLEKTFIRKIIDAEYPGIISPINIKRSKTGSEGTGRSLQGRNCTREDVLEELLIKLARLRESGWLMESIKTLIKLAKPNETTVLLQALNIIIVFQLREYDTDKSGNGLLEIFKKRTRDWIKKIQKVMILRIFSGTYTKQIDELVKETRDLNVSKNYDHKTLVEVWEEIKKAGSNVSQLCNSSKPICNWSKEEIQLWAQKFKNFETVEQKKDLSLFEKISIAKRAVEVSTDSKIVPRTVQLLSLYFMLTTEKDKGRLMQIKTGEGKTTIIAMFAAIKALEGHSVDVITSSPELAIPQSEEQKRFYQHFGLTVSHIEEGSDSLCYTANIIYGSANTFMGDVLRDEYHKLDVRCGRKFDIAIVDEVDSMLIDGKDHIVMLSSPMPALNHLEPVLAEIWVQIHRVASRIEERDGGTYYSEPLYERNENGELVEIGQEVQQLEGTKEQFLKKMTELHLRRMLRAVNEGEPPVPEDCPELKIPKHLKDLVIEVQLSNWIDSAMRACYRCDIGKDYIIENNRIVPVDALNTGIVQMNMLWSNGLHQFLQFKHGANVTPENLTTNFISNVTFFQRYGCHIYGLTGTLGSTFARDLLDKTYTVDSIIIPPFQKKQYLEIDPIISRSKKDWYQNVVQSSLIHLEHNRAVLILAKYIEDADNISRMFRTLKFDGKIKMYRTANDSDAIKGELKAGEIIIATNIAGRGTDIKPSVEVEKNGGLHVCVTFLPINQRVEEQNLGRTSRTGHRGTGQFVLLGKIDSNIIALKENRNLEEKASLERAENDMTKVFIKDQIFQKFCNLLHEVNPDLENVDTNSIPRRAIEERFAIWLRMNEANMTSETKEEIFSKFKVFKEEIKEDAKANSLPKNPCYHIRWGNELLAKKNYDEAIVEYDKAIAMDEKFIADAYYYRSFAYIAKYGKDVKKNHDKIEKAIADLKKTKEIIENSLEPMNFILSGASSAEVFSKQIKRKEQLLNIQKSSILVAVGCDVDNLVNHLKEKQNESNPKEIENIRKIIDELTANKERHEKGVIRDMMDAGRNIVTKMQDNELLIDQDAEDYEAELAENNHNGSVGCFQVMERKSLFRSIFLFILGIAKVVAGICLIALTSFSVVGACFGVALLGMGLVEIITAVKDGFCTRNKLQAWETCGILKFVLLEVSMSYYGWKAIKDTVMSSIKGKEKILPIKKALSLKKILEDSKKIGQEIGQALAPDVNRSLDYVSDASINDIVLSNIEQRIYDVIKIPIQQTLAKHKRVSRILQSGDNEYNAYIHNRIDGLVFQNSWMDRVKEKWAEIKPYFQGDRTTQISVSKVEEAVTNICHTFNKNFEKCLKDITLDLEMYESRNTLREISQNIEHEYTNGDVGDIDVTKGQVLQEQVKPDDALQKLSDDISLNLSKKMADHIRQKFVSSVQTSDADAIDNVVKKFEAYKEQRKPRNRVQGPIQLQIESKIVANVASSETLIETMRNEAVGMVHLDIISVVIKRPIVVFNRENKVVRIIGSRNYGDYVNIQYQRNGEFEYWTMPGNSEPHYRLLDLIAEQINENCGQLKDRIIKMMEDNISMISEQLCTNESRNFCYKQVLMTAMPTNPHTHV